jgi:hypothetical protein
MTAGLHVRREWKDAAVTERYEVYSPNTATGTPGGDRRRGRWHVAIEYSNEGQSRPPTVVRVTDTHYTDREEALAAAEKYAREYDPPDPFSPRGRQIYRDGPDGYLVVIAGKVTIFHMSVRVVQYVGKV